MRKLYSKLFDRRGWWSPLATAPGWFAEDLTGGLVTATLNVTEDPDEFSMEVEVIPDDVEPGVVLLTLNVTEEPDSFTMEVSLPQAPPDTSIATGPFLGGPQKRQPTVISAALRVQEEPDRFWAVMQVVPPASLPQPKPQWTPVPVPGPAVITETPPHLAPEPERPVIGLRMRVREQPDTFKAEVTVTDWVTYDNNALLLMLEET